METLRLLHKIDDLSLYRCTKYSGAELEARRKLAAAYRLVDFEGWTEGIYNHITCRVPNEESFFLNPFGLLFHEVTASNLVKVNLNGKILDRGSTNFGVNDRGFCLHSAIHAARPDVNCVLHVHMPEVIAVSALKKPYYPISQEGIIAGDVAVHDFQGSLTDLKERDTIVHSLGDKNVLLLRNHGFLTCGATVPAAFLRAQFFVTDIRAQLHLANVPPENLCPPSTESVKRTRDLMGKGEKSGVSEDKKSFTSDHQWGFGELDWEAQMRSLDALGLKTGHKYRMK